MLCVFPFQDAFSLLAYADPWASPVGFQLDPVQREPVCAALNSAILGIQIDSFNISSFNLFFFKELKYFNVFDVISFLIQIKIADNNNYILRISIGNLN